MPTYNTEPVYGLRYPAPGAQLPDYETYFQTLAQDIAAKLHGAIPLVTALPTVGPSGSGPLVDGQECYFIADATNGVIWHLRYNAGSSSPYKWEFIGGSDLVTHAVSTNTISTTAPASPIGPSTCSITLPTLPSGGDFDVMLGVNNLAGADGYDVYVGVGYGSGAALTPVGSTSYLFELMTVSGQVLAASNWTHGTGIPGGAVIKPAGWLGSSGGSTTATLFIGQLRVRPVRVG